MQLSLRTWSLDPEAAGCSWCYELISPYPFSLTVLIQVTMATTNHKAHYVLFALHIVIIVPPL